MNGNRRSRLVEAWLPRRNPLRRNSDRVAVAARWVAVVLAVVLVPLVLAAGGGVATWSEHRVEAQRAALYPTPAVVVGEPHPVLPVDGRVAVTRPVRATVRWAAPDGGPRTAVAPVGPSARQGSTVTLWLDDAGRPVAEPPSPGDGRAYGVLAATMLLLLTAAGLLVALAVVNGALDRARHRAWDREWLLLARLGDGSTR